MLHRRFAGLAAAFLVTLALAQPASAAPEVHRFNLVLSSNPTQLVADDLNEFIDDFNERILDQEPGGLEHLGRITFGWYHQAELRYFVRPNIAVSAGFGQISAKSRREFLPRISQIIVIRTEALTVPIHLGAAYYLAPYTQGDFQARAYLGGGFLSLTNNKVMFEKLEFQTDSVTTLDPRGRPSSERFKARGDGPGFYLEAGGHMFFASRYSVMLGAIYRNANVRALRRVNEVVVPGGTGTVREVAVDQPSFGLDTGGVGVRMAVAIGF